MSTDYENTLLEVEAPEREEEEDIEYLLEWSSYQNVLESALSAYREWFLKLRKKSTHHQDLDTVAFCKERIKSLNNFIHVLYNGYITVDDIKEDSDYDSFIELMSHYWNRQLVLSALNFYAEKLLKLKKKASKNNDKYTSNYCVSHVRYCKELESALEHKFIDIGNDEIPF